MQPLLPRLAALSRLTHLSAPAPYTTGDRDDGVLYGVQHVALSAQLRELQLTDLAGTEGQERLASALGRMSALTQLDIWGAELDGGVSLPATLQQLHVDAVSSVEPLVQLTQLSRLQFECSVPARCGAAASERPVLPRAAASWFCVVRPVWPWLGALCCCVGRMRWAHCR